MFDDLGESDAPKSTEVIRIGAGGSRIISITRQRIE